MYELLLSAIVPDRHEQLLRILAGVCAMPPSPITERHLVFKPTRELQNRLATSFEQVGGSQDIAAVKSRPGGKDDSDLWYTQLVHTKEGDEQDGCWEWVLPETPDAVKRPVTARQVDRLQLGQGEPLAWMKNMGYQYQNQYILQGHRFVHHNLVLFLHRVLTPPPMDVTTTEQEYVEDVEMLPTLDSCLPLDQSGAHMLTSSCHLVDGTQPELISRGMKEQVAFRDLMKGIVDMRPVERLALDTRVKPDRR